MISFDAATDLTNNGGTTMSLTHAHVVGSLANRFLVVGIEGDDVAAGNHDDLTSVTYAGVSMTFVKKVIPSGTGRFQYLYALFNPTSGNNNVVINCTNNHYLLGLASSYAGVYQGGLDSSGSDTGSSTTALSLASTVTTIADNSWVIIYATQGRTVVAPTNATLRTSDAAFFGTQLVDSNGPIHPAGGDTVTINWTTNPTPGFDLINIYLSIAPDMSVPVTYFNSVF